MDLSLGSLQAAIMSCQRSQTRGGAESNDASSAEFVVSSPPPAVVTTAVTFDTTAPQSSGGGVGGEDRTANLRCWLQNFLLAHSVPTFYPDTFYLRFPQAKEVGTTILHALCERIFPRAQTYDKSEVFHIYQYLCTPEGLLLLRCVELFTANGQIENFEAIKLCAQCVIDILQLDEEQLATPMSATALDIPTELVLSLCQTALSPLCDTTTVSSIPTPTYSQISRAPSPPLPSSGMSSSPTHHPSKSVSCYSLKASFSQRNLSAMTRSQYPSLPVTFDIFPSIPSERLVEKMDSPIDCLCARLITIVWNMYHNPNLLLKDQKCEVPDSLVHILTHDATLCPYKGLILAQRQVIRVLQAALSISRRELSFQNTMANLVEVIKQSHLPAIVRLELAECLANMIQVSPHNFTNFQYFGGYKSFIFCLQYFEKGNPQDLLHFLRTLCKLVHTPDPSRNSLNIHVETVLDLIHAIRHVAYEQTKTQLLYAINVLLTMYYNDHHPSFEELQEHKPILQLLAPFDTLSLENRSLIAKITGVVMEHATLSPDELRQYCLLLQGPLPSTVVLVSQHLTHIVSSGLVKHENFQNAGLLTILTQDCMVPPNDLKCSGPSLDESELTQTMSVVPHLEGEYCDRNTVLLHVSNSLLKLAHSFVKTAPEVHVHFKESFSIDTLSALLPHSITRNTLLQILEILAENSQSNVYPKVVQDIMGFLNSSSDDDYESREETLMSLGIILDRNKAAAEVFCSSGGFQCIWKMLGGAGTTGAGPKLSSFFIRTLKVAATALKSNPNNLPFFREGLSALKVALNNCSFFSFGSTFHQRAFDPLINLATHGTWPSCHTQAYEISACPSCCSSVLFDVPEVITVVMDVINNAFGNQPNLPSMCLFIEAVLEITQGLPENLYVLKNTNLANSILVYYSSVHELSPFESQLAQLFLRLTAVDITPHVLQKFLTLFGNPMSPALQISILQSMMSVSPGPNHSISFSPRSMFYLRGTLEERIWLPHHFSISLWFKITSPNGIIYLVHFKPQGKTPLSNLQLSLTRGTLVLQARAQASSQPSSSRGPLYLDFPEYTFKAGHWYHIVLHLDTPVRRKVLNGNANLYVNGFLVSSASIAEAASLDKKIPLIYHFPHQVGNWDPVSVSTKHLTIASKFLSLNNPSKQPQGLLLSHLQQHLIFAFIPGKMQLVQLSQSFKANKVYDSPYASLSACEVVTINKDKSSSEFIASKSVKHVLAGLGGVSVILFMLSLCQGNDFTSGLGLLHSYLAHNSQGLHEMEQLHGHDIISRFIVLKRVQADEKLLDVILKMVGLEFELGKDASRVSPICDLRALDSILLQWSILSRFPPSLFLYALDLLIAALSSNQSATELTNFNISLVLQIGAVPRFLQFILNPIAEEAVYKLVQLVFILVRYSKSRTDLQEVASFIMASNAPKVGVSNIQESGETATQAVYFASMELVKLLYEQLTLNFNHLKVIMHSLALPVLLGMLDTPDIAHRMAILSLILLYLTDNATSDYFNEIQGCSIVALQLRHHQITSGLIKIFFDIMFGYGSLQNSTVPISPPKIPMAAASILHLLAHSDISCQEQTYILKVVEEVLRKHPKFLPKSLLLDHLLEVLVCTMRKSASRFINESISKDSLTVSSPRGVTSATQVEIKEEKVEDCIFSILDILAFECLSSSTGGAESVHDLLTYIYNSAAFPVEIIGSIQRRILWNVLYFFKTNDFFGSPTWISVFGHIIVLALAHIFWLREQTTTQSSALFNGKFSGFSPSETELLQHLLHVLVNVYMKTAEKLKNEVKQASATFTPSPALSQAFSFARNGIGKVLLVALDSNDNALSHHTLQQITKQMPASETPTEVHNTGSRFSAILPKALIGSQHALQPPTVLSSVLQDGPLAQHLSLRLLNLLINLKSTDQTLQQLIAQVWYLVLSAPSNRKLKQYLPCPSDTFDPKFTSTIYATRLSDAVLLEISQLNEIDCLELKKYMGAQPSLPEMQAYPSDVLQAEQLQAANDVLVKATAASLGGHVPKYRANEENPSRNAHITKQWSLAWTSVTHECGVFPWSLKSLQVLTVDPSTVSWSLRQCLRKKINIRIPQLHPPFLGETVSVGINNSRPSGFPNPKITDTLPCILDVDPCSQHGRNGGCLITLTGLRLHLPDIKVFIGGKQAEIHEKISPTSLLIRSPAQENFGTYEIVLEYSGEADAVGTRTFSYIDCETLEMYTNMTRILRCHDSPSKTLTVEDSVDTFNCIHINPYSQHEGTLCIGKAILYFQRSQKDNNCSWNYTEVEKILPVTYQGKNSGMQVLLSNGNTVSFTFISCEQRDHVMGIMNSGFEGKEIFLCHQLQHLSAPAGELILEHNCAHFFPKKTEGKTIPVDSIRELCRRRHMLKHCALEFILVDGSGILFAFGNQDVRERVYNLIKSFKPPHFFDYDLLPHLDASIVAKEIVKSWQQGKITNFEYLMHVNTLAGRTFCDLNQYPVFPFIIRDYQSADLNVGDPQTFRDLSKPMGAQNEAQLTEAIGRYNNCIEMSMEPFLYPQTYSNSTVVHNYLIRLDPYASYHLDFQQRFDHADRLFFSLEHCWRLATNTTDVRELIPEFFYLPDFLTNVNNFNLGVRQNGNRVTHVELPNWAKGSPREFVRLHRKALECDYVSEHIHEWLDLIFGVKQQNLEANNVFPPYTAAGKESIDDIIDPLTRKTRISQLANLGQIPAQVFRSSHPKRKIETVRQNLMLQVTYAPALLIGEKYSNFEPIVSAIIPMTNDQRGQIMPLRLAQECGIIISILQYDEKDETLCGQCPRDGKVFLSGGTACVVKVWDLSNLGARPHLLFGHLSPITAIETSSQYQVVVSGDSSGTCILWDLKKLRFMHNLSSSLTGKMAVMHICICSAMGDIFVLSQNRDEKTTADAMLTHWTINGEFLGNISLPRVTSMAVTSVCEGPTYNFVATGHKNGTINLWAVHNLSLLGTISTANQKPITAISIQDNKWMYTVDSTGEATEWSSHQKPKLLDLL
ncbi:wd repeat and fyve domain [Pelomyxa schiedti]|nr:wd repeat and fyve domain [Pelomyxa schiedti]